MSEVPIWAGLSVVYAAFWVWIGVRLVNRRERWAIWTGVAMAITPVLWVLSSGPMATIAIHRHITHTPTIQSDGTQSIVATCEIDFGKWFPIAYAPLFWAAEQSWGESVFWYWELFLFGPAAEDP